MVGIPLTRGLVNDNNTCYVNSILQILARIPYVKKWTKEYCHSGEGDPKDCIKCILRDTIKDMWKVPWNIPITPTKLLQWIRVWDDKFQRGVQCDPHEFLAFLMEQTQLDIFNHVELEKVSCNVSDHGSQEEVEVIPPGPGLICNIGLAGQPEVTALELLRNYSFSLTGGKCASCDGRKCVERTFAAAPKVLLLRINRFQLQNGQWIKNQTPCIAHRELQLTLMNDETYKLTGVVEHRGRTPGSGHYITKVEDNRCWFRYSDDEVIAEDINNQDLFMAFYARVEDCDPEVIEECDVDIFMEEEVLEMQKESKGLIEEVKQWKKDYSVHIHNNLWLTKCRLLVFCIPKTCPTDSFKEQYQKCISANRRMLYTFTWNDSKFLLRIRRDPIIQRDYDVYCEKIASPFGAKKINGLLANTSICCIIDTHLHRPTPALEFMFDLYLYSAVTRAITRNWNIVKNDVIKSLPNLLRNKPLFCLDSCTETCLAENLPYHRSLANMTKMKPPEDTAVKSSMDKWLFQETNRMLLQHPLKSILIPPKINRDEDVEQQVIKYLNESNVTVEDTHRVYILLVVNGYEGHDPKDLYRIWLDNSAQFGAYVGMTKNGKFRKQHLVSEQNGGTSAVSKFLNDSSVVYLVTSLKYETFNDAALAEATLIAVLHEQLERSRKTGIQLKFQILNRNLPKIPLFEAANTARQEFDSFIATGSLPFRFINEPYQETCVGSNRALQRFLVGDVILKRNYSFVKLPKKRILYTCVICHKSFVSKYLLLRHRKNCKHKKSHNDDKRRRQIHPKVKPKRAYICHVCNLTFRYRFQLIRHNKTHLTEDREKEFSCDVCGRSFYRRDELKQHSSVHITEKNFICEVCHKSFVDNHRLKVHKKTHLEVKFICEVCQRAFSCSSGLIRHRKIHLKVKPKKDNICDVCNKTFRDSYDLTRHRKTHLQVKPKTDHICEVCDKPFRDSFELRRHMKIHCTDDVDKEFSCEICGKSFRRKDELKQHSSVHITEKNFICEVCHKGFVDNHRLQIHKKIHLEAKDKTANFICEVCDKPFRDSFELKRHMKIHLTEDNVEKEFSCEVCGKSFYRKDELKQHSSVHITEKNFVCNVCHKGFVDNHRLQIHKKIHLEARDKTANFICEVCKKAFADNCHLQRHRKIHFKEKS